MSTVKFGDFVTIQGTLIEKQLQQGQPQTYNGYLSSSGFTSNELYLERLSKALFEDQQIANTDAGAAKAPRKPEENIASVRNYRDFVFQIWPKLDFDAHKKYSKYCEEEKQLEKQLNPDQKEAQNQQDNNNPEDEDSMMQYLDEVQQKRKRAKQRMESEKENNMKQLEVFKGNEVCYGQDIFLMHADSKSFITGLVLSSETDKSAFMIQVSKFFQRGMVFKFLPRFKLRKEGEPLQYKDQIYIQNQKQNSLISFSPSVIASIDKQVAGNANLPNYYKPIDFKKHLNRQRVDVFLSKSKDITWQLHFHSEYISSDDLDIKGGDLICLYHTELQGTLTADISYKNPAGNAEAYIRKYEGEHSEEKRSVASIWEVEIDSNKQRGVNIKVGDQQSEKGSSRSYKLRHFLTGKVLSSASFQQKGKDVIGPCLAKDDTANLEQQSKVKFISTSGDGKDTMESNMCYLITLNNQFIVANPQAELICDKVEKKAASSNPHNFKDVTEDMIFKPIDDSEFEINRQSLMCIDKGATEENAFQIIKLSESEKEDVLFINSSKALLYKFLYKIRNVQNKEPAPKKEMIKRVIQVLSDLIFYLVQTDSTDPLDCEGKTNQDRQRMMKNFSYIELLADLLYYPLKLEVYKISELDQIDQEVVKIFKLCNALITHSIREYRPNEIYASQWIDLLIFQSVMTEGDCDIGSEETLTELIDNNKKILERIDEQTVKKFLQMLYDEKEAKYVKLVSALVLCNGQAVPNQELISKLMLSNLQPNLDDIEEDQLLSEFDPPSTNIPKGDGASSIIFKIKMDSGEVWIENPIEENHPYIKLIEFQNLSKQDDESKEKFEFVIEIITLLSNLCKDRNYEAINPLSRIFKRRACFEIMKSSDFLPALRNSFTQLVHTMYVDVSEIKIFTFPNNIRAWTEIDKISSIANVFDKIDKNALNEPQNKNIKYVQDHLKSFALKFLSDVAKVKYMNSMKVEYNRLTLSVLRLTELIVDFGFYNTKEQLQEILKNLFKILNSTIDITDQSEKDNAKYIIAIFADLSLKGSVNQILKKQKGITFSKFSTRYEWSEENSIVQECKILCCNIVKKIILIRNDMRVTEYVRMFKQEMDMPFPNLKGSKSKQMSSKQNLDLSMDKRRQSFANLEMSQLRSKGVSQQFGGTLQNVQDGQQSKDDQQFFQKVLQEEMIKSNKGQSPGKTAFQYINQIFIQNPIKVRGCVKIDIIAILQDLQLYKSPGLVNISFEILNLLFTERQTILNSLASLQLLENEDSIQRYFEVKKIQNDLTEKIEKSENWLFKNNERSTADATIAEKNLKTLISLLVSNNGSLMSSKAYDQSEPEGESIPMANLNIQNNQNEELHPGQLFNENDLVSHSNQELIRNCYLHQQAIDLLKYDSATFSRIRMEQEIKQSDFQDKSVHLSILRCCYKLLGRFICHNTHNQHLLLPILQEFVYQHMRTFPQVYAHYLLEPIVANNVLIVMNDDVSRRFVKEVIHCVKKIRQLSPGLAACYLDTLRFIPYMNETIVKENQTLIVNELTAKSNSVLLSSIIAKDPSFANLTKSISDLQRNIDLGSQDVIQVPEEVDYFNSLLYLLAVICDQKNNATESKAQTYVPLKVLSEWIVQFKNCIYVKRYLYFFFFHVYLDTEKEMSEELILIKKNVFKSIQEDLTTVASSLETQGFSVMSYRGKISMQKMKLDFIFESLLLCIDTILFKKLLESDQKKSFYASTYEALQLISRGPLLKQIEKKKIKGIFIQLILKNFVSVQDLKQTIKLPELIPTSYESRQVQRYLYDTQSSNQVLPPKTDSFQRGKDGLKSLVLSSQVKGLQEEQTFQDDIRNDFKLFVDYFTNIKNISQQAFRGICTIDFSELTSSMIDFMVENKGSTAEDIETSNLLQKKRLEVLRQIIELENPDNNEPVDEWESIGQYGEEIKKRQDKLTQQGVIEMIVNIIKDGNTPYDLKEEGIMLGIALLFGGNSKSQEEFLIQLQKDSKNFFLGALKEIIQKGIQIIKKSMSSYNKQAHTSNESSSKEVLENASEGEEFDEKLSDDDIQGGKEEEGDQGEYQDGIPENVIEEIKKVCRVYRLLQLFCEGHNQAMQNHLRLQIINNQESGKSIDFIYTTSLIFANVIKFINVHCVHMAEQILDFLIEAIQGPCSLNQVVMCRGKIIETCKDFQYRMHGSIETNKIFKLLGFTDQEKKAEIDSLSNKTFKLLYSLIEGAASKDIFDMLCSTLDFQFLVQILVQRYEEFKEAHKVKEDDLKLLEKKIGNNFDESLSEVFDIYLLISTLSDTNEQIKQILENPTPEQQPALEFFRYNSASIEIIFQEKLLRLYFPIQPICRLLSKSTRLALMEEIPRETPGEKIEGLVEASADLFDEMEHQAMLKSQIFFFSSQRLDVMRIISYVLSLVINFILLFSYKLRFSGFSIAENYVEDDITKTTSILGIIQFVFAIVMTIFWIIINSKLILNKSWRSLVEEYAEDQVKDEEAQIIEAKLLSLPDALGVLRKKGPEAEEFFKRGKRDFGHLFVTIYYYWKSFQFMMTQGMFIYMLFYLLVSAMGLFLSDIVYCLHLLDIIVRFPTLQNVIKAVTTNIGQLGMTTLLGAVIIYIYTIFAFYFSDVTFHESDAFDHNGSSDIENTCTTLFQCYLYTLNKGLVSGGGIGEGAIRPSYTDDTETFIFRYFFDLSFFMIINITFLNFIFGIIIDTFAQLRDEKQQKEEDKRDVCFICGLSRDLFDQVPGGFDIHIETQHQLWYYVYFIYHLRSKDNTEYNGIESYVSDLISRNETQWFPCLRAISIVDDGSQDQDTIISESFDKMKLSIKDTTFKFNKLNLKQESAQNKPK